MTDHVKTVLPYQTGDLFAFDIGDGVEVSGIICDGVSMTRDQAASDSRIRRVSRPVYPEPGQVVVALSQDELEVAHALLSSVSFVSPSTKPHIESLTKKLAEHMG